MPDRLICRRSFKQSNPLKMKDTPLNTSPIARTWLQDVWLKCRNPEVKTS